MNNGIQKNLRHAVLAVLLASLPRKNEAFLQESLLNLFPKHLVTLESNSQALARHICYGVFREYFFLSAYLNNLLTKPLRNKDIDIEIILLAGTYELLFLKTPEHAVISEWVELCGSRKKIWAKGLVNALLRKIQTNPRNIAQLKEKLSHQNHNLEFKYQHPLWLIKQLQHDWLEKYETIIAANNNEPTLTLRVNTRFISLSSYCALLRAENISVRESVLTDNCIYVENKLDVTSLPHFKDGWISVQDESAQQAAKLLNVKPGHKVLDACSAPGGKSSHILELCSDIDLLCLDLSESRLLKVQQNLDRLQLKANIKVADAAELSQWWDGQVFDRILLDAPCSASGIIRRHPDIKLIRKQSDLQRMAQQQLLLLQNLWSALAPGGMLLYCTCSIFKDENERVLEGFIKLSKAKELKINLPFGEARDCGWQIFPDINNHDGFYYALLQKPSSEEHANFTTGA